MALSDDDGENVGNQRRAWAQQPVTVQVAEEAKLRLEAKLLELVAAARVSPDARVASLAGALGPELDFVGLVVREKSGRDFTVAFTVRFDLVKK